MGQSLGQTLNGWPIRICRSEEGVYAVIDRCPHAGAPLWDGRVRRNTITCPLHGARFDLATGKPVNGHYRPLMTFPLRVIEGRVEVAVPDEQPSMELKRDWA